MWGIELANPVTGHPAGDLARAVQGEALRRGLILECGGRHDCVVRLLPPLIVDSRVIGLACEIVVSVITELSPSLSEPS